MLKKFFNTLLIMFFLSLPVMTMTADDAHAQPRGRQNVTTTAVDEEKRPKGFIPWIVGIVLSAGIIALCGFKDARRIQSDRQ